MFKFVTLFIFITSAAQAAEKAGMPQLILHHGLPKFFG
jgi:hypothetical protein